MALNWVKNIPLAQEDVLLLIMSSVRYNSANWLLRKIGHAITVGAVVEQGTPVIRYQHEYRRGMYGMQAKIRQRRMSGWSKDPALC